MVQDDPDKRPTMNVVVKRFNLIRQHLSTWKLRSRVAVKDEGLFDALYRGATHWRRRITFIVKHTPAVPPLRE
jgi:hypothetical protein